MSRYHIAHLLIEAAGKRRIKDLAAKHGLTEDEVRAMAEFDPTDTDKFLGWIAKQVASNELSIPAAGPELRRLLEAFGRKGKLIGEPDIDKWTFTGLKEKLSVTESKGEVERSKVEEGQRVFYDKSPWKVIEITTPEAASKLLRPEWCIKDKKFWKQYGCSARHPAYLVFKNGRKYACMVPHKGELKGTNDKPLRSTKVFAKLLKKLAPRMKITWISDFLRLEHLVKAPGEIKMDPESAFLHARDTIGGPWPYGESVIAADPKWACEYALYVVGRFPEGEAAIARDPKSAVEYAIYVVGDQWPAGEAAIARDPKSASEYALFLGDPNWADKYNKAPATRTP